MSSSSDSKPKTLAEQSIPGLLTTFQNEFDALMVESFNLKQQLQAANQELSQMYYQHDAACRVIARLVKQRDQYKQELMELKASGVTSKSDDGMDVDSDEQQKKVEAMKEKLTTTFKQVSAQRKDRKISATLATVEDIATYEVKNQVSGLHGSSGINTLHMNATQDKLVTGGADGKLVVVDKNGNTLKSKEAHKTAVNTVKFHPHQPWVISGGDDQVVSLWNMNGGNPLQSRHHSKAVTSVDVHVSGDYVLSTSLDATSRIFDINDMKPISTFTDPEHSPLSVGAFHPDGMLFAAGSEDNTVKLWNINAKKCASTLPLGGKATSIAFSQNGFYFATASADGILKLWDLRKSVTVSTVQLEGVPQHIAFDDSGRFVAVGYGKQMAVYSGKDLAHVRTWEAHTKAVSSLQWGTDAQTLYSVSKDATLKIFGK